MNPTAFSYIRWSSAPQGDGRTEERQADAAEAYALKHGLTLDTKRNMRDEGVSGYSGKNVQDGALGAFIKAIEAGHIAPGSFLLVEDIDRLSRLPVMEALAVFQRIIGAGITVVTLGENPQRYSAEILKGEWYLLMPLIVGMGRAHAESERKSVLIGDAWRKKKVDARKIGKPIGNNAPMWIDYSEKAGYTLNPTKHELVKRIFRLYLDGYGMVAIARMLNDEGILTSRGSTWGPSSLDRVLINRAVIGEYQPGSGSGNERSKAGDPIPNFYPAAIDEATYYEAQQVRNSRRRTRTSKQSKNFNVFQGIGKCHSCHAPLHSITKGTALKSNTYLRCSSARKHVCKSGYIRLDSAELVFREVLVKASSASALIHDASANLLRQQATIKGQIAEHEAHLKQLVEVLQSNTSTTILNEVVRRESSIAELNKQVEAIAQKLASNSIIDKAAFFASLDLVSYEGRNRANSLLKELDMTIRVATGKPIRYHIYQGDKPLFDVVNRGDGGITAYPANAELAALIWTQDGSFAPRLTDNDTYEEDYDDTHEVGVIDSEGDNK